MWERLVFEGKSELENPILIVSLSTSLSQYKAMYSQARELATFVLKEMRFERLATIYSSGLPPVAVVSDDGTVRLSSATFYGHRGRRDVLLLAGDSSPQDYQYEFAESVLRYAGSLGAKEMISIGARWTEQVAAPAAVPRLTGFAGDEAGVEVLRGHGIEIIKDEPAPFFASLIVALAGEFGMRGYKLSVDHGEPTPHPLSVIQLLRALEKMAGLRVETEELESRAREMAKEISSLTEQESPPERGGVYG
ncbi:MAG: PAC2 family protein [Nitrososphaerales archaeon]|jgi:proteasome assembly chaperone (PAC2) family protein